MSGVCYSFKEINLLCVIDPPTQDLVNRITALYEQGRTDVRSMIPVLSGLDKVVDLLWFRCDVSKGSL